MTITRFPRAPFSAAELGEASLVIVPSRGAVVEAGHLVRDAFEWWQEPWREVRLDASMPGLAAVRAFLVSTVSDLRSDTAQATSETKDLVFWTRNGAINATCKLERITYYEEADAVRVHVVRINGSSWPAMMPLPPRRQAVAEAGAQKTSKPAKKGSGSYAPKKPVDVDLEAERHAEPRQIAQASFMVARHGEPSLTLVPHDALTHVTGRTDEATLELIAKRIREGILSGAVVPAPESIGDKPMLAVAQSMSEHKEAQSLGAAADHVATASGGDDDVAPTKPDVMQAVDHNDDDEAAGNEPAQPLAGTDSAPEPSTLKSGGPAATDASVTRTLAQIAHDIKTPLSAISAASEIIRDERLGPDAREKYKTYAADIHASARHALDIVDRLMREAASQAPPSKPAPEPKQDHAFPTQKTTAPKASFDVNGVLSACAKQVRPLTDQRRQKLLLRLDPSAGQLAADPVGFKQSVLNLITNAMKFTPAGGSITLETIHLATGGVAVAVLDTGRGMTKAAAARQADPELAAGIPASRSVTGLGLGLPQVRDYCAKNNARFGIDSALGQGTVVTMTFKS